MAPITEDVESHYLRLAQDVEDLEEIKRRIRKLRLEQLARRRQQRLEQLADTLDSSDNSSEDEQGTREEDQEVVLAPEDDFRGRKMVRAATFAHVWNCLNDDGLEDDPGEVDRGWLSALQGLHRAVSVAAYAPTSVLHRFVCYLSYCALG